MRRAATIAAIVVATLLCFGALWAFRSAVLLFVLSLVVGAALRPVVDRMVKDGWPLKTAIAVVYVVAVGAVLAIIFVLGAEIVLEVPTATQALAEAYERATTTWPTDGGLRAFVAARLPAQAELYRAVGQLDAGEVAVQAVSSGFGLLALLGNVLVVIALAIYWSVDRDAFERLWLSLIPVAGRTRARAVWTETRRATGAIFRQEIGTSALVAVGLAFALPTVGFTYWGLAALAVAVLRLIPLLGMPSAALATGLLGIADGLAVAGIAAGVALAWLIALRLVRGRLFSAPRINPILAILTVLGLYRVYELPGLLAAPLVAIAIQTIFGELVATQPTEETPPTLADLRERAAAIDRGARVLPHTPELANLVERLRRLLGRADQL